MSTTEADQAAPDRAPGKNRPTPKRPRKGVSGNPARRAEVAGFYSKKSTAKGSWKGNKRKVATSATARDAAAPAGDAARLSAMATLPEPKKSLVG